MMIQFPRLLYGLLLLSIFASQLLVSASNIRASLVTFGKGQEINKNGAQKEIVTRKVERSGNIRVGRRNTAVVKNGAISSTRTREESSSKKEDRKGARKSVDCLSKEWSDLNNDCKNAVEELGYNQQSWDNFEEVDTSYLFWNELTKDQQNAAAYLGFNKNLWDSTPVCVSEFQDLEWADLDDDIKEAAIVLGYTPELWNSKGAVSTDNKYWNALSSDEQDAAGKFGFTQMVWDTCENPQEAEETEELDAANNGIGCLLQNWEQLSLDCKNAATALGYDQNSWDNEEDVYTSGKSWDELTQDHQNAAAYFGFGMDTWNELNTPNATGSTNEDELVPDSAGDISSAAACLSQNWYDMSLDCKNAATTLGYDQKSWDNEEDVSTSGLSWDELTQDHQNAAAYFGFDMDMWNEINTPNAGCNKAPADVDCLSPDWDDLSFDCEKAAADLGYNKQAWDNFEAIDVSVLFWHELTQKQQCAATYMGYDKGTWNTAPNCSSPYDAFEWDELDNLKTAATLLGHNELSWNGDAKVNTDYMVWSDLSLFQKGAAQEFEYTEALWNLCKGPDKIPAPTMLPPMGTLKPIFNKPGLFPGFEEKTYNFDLRAQNGEKKQRKTEYVPPEVYVLVKNRPAP